MSAASDALAAACQALTDALGATAPDPADGIALLVRFIGTTPVPLAQDLAVAAAQQAAAALMRRSALLSLSGLCAAYQPGSSTEAFALRDQVLALLDADILLAADAGERDAYSALRAVRTAVADDLTRRGTGLPALVTVTTPIPEPSLVIAWKLYADTRREPGLVARAGVIHPLFMPMAFEGLSR